MRTVCVPPVFSLRTVHMWLLDEPDHPGALRVNVWHEAGENPLSSPWQVSTHWALTSSFVQVSGWSLITVSPLSLTATTVAQ